MTRPPDEPDARVLLSLPLTFDGNGTKLHCPMVVAEVGGVRTKLIVDTGATAHLFTVEFADRAGVSYRPGGESGTDSSGSSIDGYAIGLSETVLGGATLPLTDVVAIEGPEPFAGWGVGGFLSPQRLWPDETVVVDLSTNTLLVLRASLDALRHLLSERCGNCIVVDGNRHSSGTLAVTASVVPHDPVVALFDTGAATTDASAAAVATAALPQTHSGRGVSGASIAAAEVRDQVLAVAGVHFPIASLGIRDRIPAPEGARADEEPEIIIGMDVMRGTTLAIAPDESGELWWFVKRPQP